VLVQRFDEIDKHRREMSGRHRIEQVADLLGTRNLMHAE
jgi:hypothetical protein